MSFFIYASDPNLALGYFSEDYQAYYQQASNIGMYPPSNFFFPTNNFSSAPFCFTEYPCYQNATDILIPTLTELPQVQNQPLNFKQSRKRSRNSQKQLESAKKNSESNLINHLFSYFSSRQKSQKTVEASINSLNKEQTQKQKLLHLFYNTIHTINARRGRKYVNKKILLTLFQPKELLATVPEMKEKIQKINEITIEQISQVFRKCCYSFYRTHSIDSILTSKRISCLAKQQHFKKRRKVLKAFRQKQ